jgi:hypothetical protein
VGRAIVKRTGFNAKSWPFPPRPSKTVSDDYKPRPRTPAPSRKEDQALVTPAPKQQYLRDKDYLRWVASLPCAHCRIQGRSQAAHSDDNGPGGKGMGIKACDSTAYPACAPTLGDPGCHWRIGSSGAWTKAERHALEQDYAANTQAAWAATKGLR